MANKWIDFVKKYASDNKMKYSEALKDSKVKEAYQQEKERPEKEALLRIRAKRAKKIDVSNNSV